MQPTESARCRLAVAEILDASTANLEQNSQSVARNHAEAVHTMRIALARLRAALQFFRPFVNAKTRKRLKREIRWLGRELGRSRDIDMAIERGKPSSRYLATWNETRLDRYEHVSRALRTKRYQGLLEQLREAAQYCRITTGNDPVPDDYVWDRITGWTRKIVERGRQLDRLSNTKVHRLRLQAKRLRHAAEWSAPLLTQQRAKFCKNIQKPARSLQQTLGDLTDAEAYRKTAKLLELPKLPGLEELRERKFRRRAEARAKDAIGELHSAIKKASSA